MSEIHVKEGESIDSALKRFKRSCAKAGVIAEVRKREHYESPSVKRRKKSEAARKRKYKKENAAQAVRHSFFGQYGLNTKRKTGRCSHRPVFSTDFRGEAVQRGSLFFC